MADMLKTYTLEDAAEVLHLSRNTVYRYVKDGQIKAVKLGQKFIISTEELDFIIHNGLRDKETSEDVEKAKALKANIKRMLGEDQ